VTVDTSAVVKTLQNSKTSALPVSVRRKIRCAPRNSPAHVVLERLASRGPRPGRTETYACAYPVGSEDPNLVVRRAPTKRLRTPINMQPRASDEEA
jgi:hypothetical protein